MTSISFEFWVLSFWKIGYYSGVMDSVITIPAFGDNFAYVYRCDKQIAIAVDPSDSAAVMGAVKERGLKLIAILVTHHHFDHTAGVSELKKKTGCEVIGGDRRIVGIDRVVSGGEVLRFGEAEIKVVATPGHTRTSVCYYKRASKEESDGIVWTGDTLFVGGCGRIIECGPAEMWESLMKLARLEEDMLICCGHNYTEENFEFALSIEPDNKAVKQRLEEVRLAQKRGEVIASTVLDEKKTNIFLRADTAEVKAAVGMSGASGVDVFVELRRRKDYF
jgi:hydroxyacylglutathione hydrolase